MADGSASGDAAVAVEPKARRYVYRQLVYIDSQHQLQHVVYAHGTIALYCHCSRMPDGGDSDI
jgi:hypothetical protein